VALAVGAVLWFRGTEYFWRNPIADARVQAVTDFGGVEQAAAVSRDGNLVAFLSDRDGQTDVWIKQIGSGQLRNLTNGSVNGLGNPSIRSLGFSPDGSFVTYWDRRQDGDISVWAVPTLGGEPKTYLEGVAEYDWSRDGSRLAYHTPGPGDPLFVSDGSVRSGARPIFTAAAGLHSHFPLWSPDANYIYFVQGLLPDRLDIWRIPSGGRPPERITSHNGRVTYPVFLDRRTLMYLASDPDGSGPWLYSVDVERRIPHRLTFGLDRYTSLAASADGRKLVVTLASPKRTLWRLRIPDSPAEPSAAVPISLTTSVGFAPRLGPGYLLYVSATGAGESIWKLVDGAGTGRGTELWSSQGARVIGGPAISPDGQRVAFSVRQGSQTLLYVMQADGTNARVVTDTLALQGSPAWEPDGRSITSAADDHGVTHLFRVPLDGQPPAAFVQEYSFEPAWAPDGSFVAYSGPDIGTTFSVKAVTAKGEAHPLPGLTLTRGARHLALLPGGLSVVLMRGEIQHKNLWLVDLQTGAERQLTNLPPDFDLRDFDISPDGREVVLEREQERSDVMLLDLARR
jgi:Tol biopolymer transport system component